jgi:hypothetical protein
VLVLHNAVRKRQEVPARVLLAVVSTYCEISMSTKLFLHLKYKIMSFFSRSYTRFRYFMYITARKTLHLPFTFSKSLLESNLN